MNLPYKPIYYAVFVLFWAVVLFSTGSYETYQRQPEISENAHFWLVEDVINRLIQCESGGNNLAYNFDTNNRYSIGVLQFQVRTARYYLEKYNLPGSEYDDLKLSLILHNSEFSKNLAREILIRENAWRNWYNCSKKIGVDVLLSKYD